MRNCAVIFPKTEEASMQGYVWAEEIKKLLLLCCQTGTLTIAF